MAGTCHEEAQTAPAPAQHIPEVPRAEGRWHAERIRASRRRHPDFGQPLQQLGLK